MKKVYLLLVAGLSIGSLLAQKAPVPTSWNCDDPSAAPVGWQFYVGNEDVSTHKYAASNACEGAGVLKLDRTGEAVIISLSSQPGVVTFYAEGQAGGGAPWQGTFTAQESADSITWTTAKTYPADGGMIMTPACGALKSFTPQITTRYIKLELTSKTTGYNVRLDDIQIAAPVFTVGTVAVDYLSNNLPINATTLPVLGTVGSTTPVNFTLKNVGTVDALNISAINITGANAADFSLVTPVLPATIPAIGNTPFEIDFNPTSAGTKTATVTITSDDPSSPFVFHIYAVAGNLATAPIAAPTNLTFPMNKTYRTSLSFNTVSDIDYYGGYLVLRSVGAPVAATPVNGTTYQAGQGLGNAKVAFVGKLNGATATVFPRYTEANTEYHYAVYAYNGTDAATSYTSALVGNMTTPAKTMRLSAYYNNIDKDVNSFISDLNGLINPHTSTFYSNYQNTLLTMFIKDTLMTVGANTFSKYLTCVYSGEIVHFNVFDFGATGTSREHTFAHSWMPTNPANNPEKPEYNDQHNLFPTIQVGVNDQRCNYPFGVVADPIAIKGEGAYGRDADGNRVYEPRDEQKGAVARALFYMTTTYNGIAGNNWNFTAPVNKQCNTFKILYEQDQVTMKKWHFQHLPSNFDVTRNDYLDSLQKNRNPFIDNPEWVCYIDFTSMTYVANPDIQACKNGITRSLDDEDTLSMNNIAKTQFLLFPNPSEGNFNINIYGAKSELANVKMLDLTGRVVSQTQFSITEGNNVFNVSENVSSGVYLVEVTTSAGKATQRIIIK